jgi:hypothetical protein
MTQSVFVASLGGAAAQAVLDMFNLWRGSAVEKAKVDRFCDALLANKNSLPILGYCKWIDRWLMGDLLPGPDAVEGHRFQAACMSPAAAEAWANHCGSQWPEQVWLANRLREVAAGWGKHAEQRLIVVVREVFDVSTTDDQVTESFGTVPAWLQTMISDQHS